MSWLWLWHVDFDLLLSCGGCVCVFGVGVGVGPMFLGFSGVYRGWPFGDNKLILSQTEGNSRDYHVHIFEQGVCLFLR